MSVILTIVHVVVCLLLILIVLLQSGKSADLAGAFGGGGSQTAFGARGTATFLSKLTTGAAVIFMLTSMGLSIVGDRERGSSVMQDAQTPAQKQTAPVTTPQQKPEENPASSEPGMNQPASPNPEQPANPQSTGQ